MAGSLRETLTLVTFLLTTFHTIQAETITKNFTISWVPAAPDGRTLRQVIGVNDAWPPPILYATKGDRIVINVVNNLEVNTSLHFHGIFQKGTTYNDGASGVTQCPIPPNGGKFQYDFTVGNQSGTYWYHSHTQGQYPDGLRAPMIIRDPEGSILKNNNTEEVVVSLSDWYNERMSTLMDRFMSPTNPRGWEPSPDTLLINDTTANFKVKMVPRKTYLFRIVNMAALASFRLRFQDHPMTVVEVDGVYTNHLPLTSPEDTLYITAGQRYSVLITAKDNNETNFPFVATMDTSNLDNLPDGFNPDVTGWLFYNEAKPCQLARPIGTPKDVDDVQQLVPADAQGQFGEVNKLNKQIWVTASLETRIDGTNRGLINGTSYMPPKVPTLYSALSLGANATRREVYGKDTNPWVINKGDVIDLILYNDDNASHPFHLHGHNFQVLHRSSAGPDAKDLNFDPNNFNSTPIRRDVIRVNPFGNIVIRFVADNPGVWLFHCHMEWHMRSGLALTFIEAPEELQKMASIPDNHYAACAAGIPPIGTKGNAVGNLERPVDLPWEDHTPDPLPDGFTHRGRGIMAVCIVCGLVGLISISYYASKIIDLQENEAGDRDVGEENNGRQDDVQEGGGNDAQDAGRMAGAQDGVELREILVNHDLRRHTEHGGGRNERQASGRVTRGRDGEGARERLLERDPGRETAWDGEGNRRRDRRKEMRRDGDVDLELRPNGGGTRPPASNNRCGPGRAV